MKRSTMFALGIIAAVLTTVVAADLALARGGGNGAGQHISRTGSASQFQYKHHNRFQYRVNDGSEQTPAQNRAMRSGQYPNRDHVQLRDPATHNPETFMPAATQ